MNLHGLDRIFRFVAATLEEKQKTLLIEQFPIVVKFVFDDVLLEFPHLFALIFVMNDLTEIVKTSSFLALLSLLVFFLMVKKILEGK